MSHTLRLLVLGLVCITAFIGAERPAATANEQISLSSADQLRKLLLPVIERHRGEVAVVFKHLPTGETFAYRPDEAMPTASLIKLPLLMAAYKAIEKGDAQLDQRIILKKVDQVPGSGVLTPHFSPGLELSLRDAMQLMIAYSDNTATNLVIDQVGLDATNELMKSLGCTATRLNSKVYRRDTSNDPERSRKFGLGSTSCNDMLKLLEMIDRREFLSAGQSERILQHLYDCEARSTVPRHLPAGVRVAHKTGSVSDTRTDAGLIDSPTGAIAYCVLTTANVDRSWGDSNEAELLAAELGKAAYDYFVGETEPAEPAIARELKLGDQGDLVEALQRTLNKRLDPSPGLSVDGDFGPNTESAVIRFQKDEELEADGVVNAAVWRALGPLVMDEEPVPDPETVNADTLKKLPPEPLDGPPVVTCQAWTFVDAATGETIAGENANVVRDPASTTKLMTAYLIVKLAESDPAVLNETVTFSRRADRTPGSTSGVKAGEQLPVGELLYGLMLPSGNDAAVAVAEFFGERLLPNEEGASYDRFIQAMNAEAKKLGMDDTQFKNPHGLTAQDHVSTASDLAKLARAALDLPLLRKIVATRQYGTRVKSVAGYERNVMWKNTNRLLGREGYTGMKTGTTGPAGACLIACGERDGRELIAVVLGSSCSDARYSDIRNLYRWVWSQAELATAASP